MILKQGDVKWNLWPLPFKEQHDATSKINYWRELNCKDFGLKGRR